MNIGTMSLSLNVRDIKKSKEFYEKIDFEIIMGSVEEKWLILRNGESTIGIFEGQFDKNIITFNPGWDTKNQALESFDDVTILEKEFVKRKVKFISPLQDKSFFIEDPDGNMILIDQHV